MLDPTTLPILLRTLDFLFEEGSKILQERRERRNPNQRAKQKENVRSQTDHLSQGNREAITSKEKALTVGIAESAWSDSEGEIQHLLSLLEIYRRNYFLAREQYAKFGSALVPQVILHNLEEAENSIEATMKKMKSVLRSVYSKDLVVPEID